MIAVRVFEDGNDAAGRHVGDYETEREARRAAARALGRDDLRGSASWPTESGVVYQFGKHEETEQNQSVELSFLD